MLGDIWVVKVILVRSWIEMRKVLLDNGEKLVLI